MLTVVILFLVIYTSICIHDRYQTYGTQYLFNLLPAALISAFCCIFILLISGAVAREKGELVLANTYELESINDNSSMTGRFFLGSGGIGESMQFAYYQKQEDGSFTLESVKAHKASVIYSQDKPKVEVYNLEYDGGVWLFDRYKKGASYKFYVPEGSINSNYELDAQ